MSQKLSGKVALVTGGTSGIGLATSKQFVLNASTTSIKGTPAFSVYSATKAAVRSLIT